MFVVWRGDVIKLYTVAQSSTFWGSYSADAVESQLLGHRFYQHGLHNVPLEVKTLYRNRNVYIIIVIIIIRPPDVRWKVLCFSAVLFET